MNLRSSLCVDLVVSCASFGAARFNQDSSTTAVTIKLARLAFETGIRYNESIATASVTCTLKDIGATMDWGDDGPVEMLSTTELATAARALRHETYHFFSTHQYAAPGKYNAILRVSGHCPDNSSTIDTKHAYSILVFERVPVQDFSADSASVRTGSRLRLSVKLVSLSPPSGTRVYLAAANATDIAGYSRLALPMPRFIEVAPGDRTVNFTIQVPESAGSGKALISALGVDGFHRLSISIN